MTNVIGFLNVMNWVSEAEPRCHIVLASSREVYGEPKWVPVTEDHPKEPKSVYGTSKLTSEQLLTHFGLAGRLTYTIVRFSNVYGSIRDLPERVIPRFIDSAISGEPLILNGGNQILDFTFIDDVVEGLAGLFSRIESGNQSAFNADFNFCSGQGTSIRELAEMVIETTRSGSSIAISPRHGYDVMKFVGDSSKAQRVFGFRAKVDIRSGLKKYAESVLASKAS